MALRQAKIQPTLQEKRYIELQVLEAAFVSGNRVIITPVNSYTLSNLSSESYEYGDPIETYIIYDERPKVSLLKKHGWYREDEENLPQIAIIPTWLLYERFAWDDGTVIQTSEPVEPVDGSTWFDEDNNLLYTYSVINDVGSWDAGVEISTVEPEAFIEVGQQWFDEVSNKLYTVTPGPIVNEVLLDGNDMSALSQYGYSDTYELRPLKIQRGVLVDVFFDFAPETGDPGDTSGYYHKIDHSTVINRFYVTEVHIDTVSINYTAKLMAYKYEAVGEAPEGSNPSNGEFLNIDFQDEGL